MHRIRCCDSRGSRSRRIFYTLKFIISNVDVWQVRSIYAWYRSTRMSFIGERSAGADVQPGRQAENRFAGDARCTKKIRIFESQNRMPTHRTNIRIFWSSPRGDIHQIQWCLFLCVHAGRAHDVVVFIKVHMQVCSQMTDMCHLQT